MNPRAIRSLRDSIAAFLFVVALPMAASAAEPGTSATPIGSSGVKSLGGSFVVLDPAAGGSACWEPGISQTFCFRAESFTDDWEFVDNLWLLFSSGWTVTDVSISGAPSCDSGEFGVFSWSFHTPSYEINIDQQRVMGGTDHCTAVYCVDAVTGGGGGDASVSWYWDGDDFGDPPHWPCSDDGYAPSGQPACDENTLPPVVIPDCSSFGALEGMILDSVTVGPVCTEAVATANPGGVLAQADSSGAYGPIFLVEGPYDVTAAALGFEDLTVSDVGVLAGGTTVQDFDLVRPVVEASPATIDTAITIGTTGNRTIVVDNLGAAPPLDWTLRELPPTEMINPISESWPLETVSVEPELDAVMQSRGEAAILIEFRERPDLSPALTLDWHDRGRFVVDALTRTAERTQTRVRNYLDSNRVEYQAFWIDNIIVVSKATHDIFEGLLAFDEIEILRADRVLGVIEPIEREPSTSGGRAVEPNLSHILANEVWSFGFDGFGMVVANLDTGVRYSHEVLEPHYRGNLGGGAFDHNYNWLDGVDGSSVAPYDDHGHGSHTMGVMVGDDGGANQIGMAPGATWIACDACESTGCPSDALLTCAQWIAAPYPIGDPDSPDPSKRPHVVNNSWGDCDTSYDNWFQGSVDSWHAAGIYPVFSNGNASNCGYLEPAGCNTAGNPGRYGNVTSVGSTGQFNGVYATHSNWGPTDNLDTINPNGYPSLKPQVLAPGVDIRSSLNTSDTAYGSWDGTSMSAPHISALIALMWQAAPCLVGDYAQTETIIQDSAVAIAYASFCGGEGPGNVPSMATGWGEIDALEAVTRATLHCNTDWLPWVIETPDGGLITYGGTEDIIVTFTCGPDPGDETGALRLTTNDPCDQTTDIPLVLRCVYAGDVDLAISKTDGLVTAVPGTPLMYTIGVTNSGPSDAIGAEIADTFVAHLTDVGWSCGSSGGATCTAAGSGSIADTVTVPVGGLLTYTVNATLDPTATGMLSNTATVSAPSGVVDLDPDNNSATDTTELTPEVDLGVSKTDGLSSMMPGDPITYTISVANAGPSTAVGAFVTDTFPAAVTGISWSCAASGGASCAASGAGDINDTVSLPTGGSVVYTATGTVSAAATGTLSNTATAVPAAGVTDTNPTNNSATDTTVLTPEVDLGVSKTDGLASVIPGESITYTISVTNAGPLTAAGAVVSDSFSAVVTGISWSCAASTGASCTASGAGDINDTVTLPAGGSVVYTATGTVSAAATGTLSNTATVAPPAGVTDPNPSNNSATDTTVLAPVADLGVSKTDGLSSVMPGDPITYTISVANAGPSNAVGAFVTDTFPAAVTGISWSCAASGGSSCAASGAGDINDTVSLPTGGSVVYTATGTVSAAATGTLSNTATVAPPTGVTDTNSSNNSSTDTTVLAPEADLGVNKTDGLSSIIPGDPITYTISVANAGPSTAVGAFVTDSFPAAITGISWSCVASAGASCTASGAGDINDTVTLPSGGTLVYTAIGTVSPTASGTLSNTAAVAPPAGVTDNNPSNDSATDITLLIPLVDLSITKSDGVASAVPGESVTYIITVSNGGPHDAVGAVVEDSFPAELGNVEWSCEASTGAVCTASGSGNIVDTVTVPAGGSVTYTVTADIDPGAVGVVANTAGVEPSPGTSDPDPGNNAATDTDTLTPITELNGYLNDWVCWLWPGDSTTYTLAVHNDGPSDAMGAVVEDHPPAILTGVTWTCTASGGADCPASGAGVINEAVGLPVGGSVEFQLTGIVDPSAGGALLNEASATPPIGAVDPTPLNAVFGDWDALEPSMLCEGFEDGTTGGWSLTSP